MGERVPGNPSSQSYFISHDSGAVNLTLIRASHASLIVSAALNSDMNPPSDVSGSWKLRKDQGSSIILKKYYYPRKIMQLVYFNNPVWGP